METSNEKVDSIDSKVESIVETPSSQFMEDESQQETNINEDIKTESTIIGLDKDVNETPDNAYNQRRKQVDLDNGDENTMIEDNINPDVTSFDISTSQIKALDAPDYDKNFVTSPPTKCGSDCSHDSIEREDLPKNNFVEIRKEMKTPSEEIIHELPAKEDKDTKTAAAEISQQNYENTLRCQNQDFISEVIENNTHFQYDDAEDTTDSTIVENSAGGQEEKTNLYADEANTSADNIEQSLDQMQESLEKSLIDQTNENIVTNEDDSFQSVATSEGNTKQALSPGSPNDEYFSEVPASSSKKSAEDCDLIYINEDNSQNRDRQHIEISKNNDNKESENRIKLYRADSNLTQSNSTNDESNEVICKETKGIGIDGDEHEQPLENLSINDNVKNDEINKEVMGNTQSIKLLIKEKETLLDSKSWIQENNVQMPVKLNGDHKMTPMPIWDSQKDNSSELDTQLEAKAPGINEKEQPKAAELEDFKKLKNEPSIFYAVENKQNEGISNVSMSAESQQSKVNCDDENSHCSSLTSIESNSTATSSSHQLVIDQPMDESEAGISVASIGLGQINSLIQLHEKSEKVNTSKPSLKRKLSKSSETETGSTPLHKQSHIELALNDNENSRYSCDKDQTEAMAELITEERKSTESSDIINKADAEHAPFKSLLLQHLQKPYSAPSPTEKLADYAMPLPNFTQQLQTTLFDTISPKLPVTTSNPNGNISTSTKYLCFKCKVGSFISFASLNEHQRECLADTRLLPARLNENANLLPLSLAPQLATPPSSASPDATVDMVARNAVLQTPLSSFTTPSVSDTATQKKIYYKCSSCNTFHQNWNLFLHILDKHQRHMCMYCIRFFPTAEKLSVHLEIKHDLEQNHFNSEDALRKSISVVGGTPSESRFLMCCTCQHLFDETEPFSDHNCAEFMKPCTLCGQKGRHSNQCKAHPDAKRTSKTKKRLKKSVGEFQLFDPAG